MRAGHTHVEPAPIEALDELDHLTLGPPRMEPCNEHGDGNLWRQRHSLPPEQGGCHAVEASMWEIGRDFWRNRETQPFGVNGATRAWAAVDPTAGASTYWRCHSSNTSSCHSRSVWSRWLV